jgi:uncharacterized protein YdiU (UPF0061 family)
MCLGFIHGVMNTDNTSISGETIDYGPCAFMDKYDPKTVFSSIDHAGRYAYANQPGIAQWNVARLAETLLPLIDSDTDKAVRLATEVVESFIARFDAHFLEALRRKIGLASVAEWDAELINRLLATMHNAGADFTLTFRGLALEAENPDDAASGPSRLREMFGADSAIDGWLRDWRERLVNDPQSATERGVAMRRVNPAFIPRNHRVEAALDAASNEGDYQPFQQLVGILQHPYDDQPEHASFGQAPEPSDRVFKTFCGT